MNDKRLIEALSDWVRANPRSAMLDNHEVALRDLRERLAAADFTIVTGLNTYIADLAREKEVREQESPELLGWEYDLNRAKVNLLGDVIRNFTTMR